MKEQVRIGLKGCLAGLMLVFAASLFAHPINNYYKKHKDDQGMEARAVPPKLASLMIDEDYPEAIDVLQAMTSLKYLNFHGDKKQIRSYVDGATLAELVQV